MSGADPKSEDSETMTPDAAAVIARARRSFAFSIGLLLLGFAAVAIALVYRTGGGEGTPGDAYAAGVLTLPAGAEVISAAPSEDMFAIAYSVEGKTRLRLIDGTTGAVIRDIDFVSE